MMPRETNVLAIIKGKERFVFLFDDDSLGDLLAMLNRYADDPRLDFTFHDALMLRNKAISMVRSQQDHLP